MNNKLINRFEALIVDADKIKAMKKFAHSEYTGRYETLGEEGDALFLEWKTKAENVLKLACGPNSPHYDAFKKNEVTTMYDSNIAILGRLQPIMKAAYDDLKSGFLITLKQLVQAEVFDDELEQAKELFNSGYSTAAAVIAGVVLETTIRDLCNNNGIPTAKKKLEVMNADLVKAGVYNVLEQKKITVLADIRNKAAHGKSGEFTTDDVEKMIDSVEAFLIKHLC